MIEVPRIVRNKALALGASSWLDELPRLVASLEDEWSIAVGRSYADATEAFVADATLADGTQAVLKLMVGSADAARCEIAVLRLVDGDGCVRLLRADEARGALLVERLGRSLFELGLPVAQRHELLCATAARVWRPAADCDLPTGAEKACRLIEYVVRTWDSSADRARSAP